MKHWLGSPWPWLVVAVFSAWVDFCLNYTTFIAVWPKERLESIWIDDHQACLQFYRRRNALLPPFRHLWLPGHPTITKDEDGN